MGRRPLDTIFNSSKNRREQLVHKMPKGEGLTKSYALSADLAAVVGRTHASRGEVIKYLWAYIKEHKLQDPENKQYFTPDRKMAKIFGEEKIRGFGMAKFLSKHLY